MKNSCKILTLSLLLSSSAALAVPFMPEFGVKGGMGISSVSVTGGGAEYSSSFGFLVGGAASVNLGLVGVDVDVLYARRGWEAGEMPVRTNQLYVPVQLDYGVGPALLTFGGYYSALLGNVSIDGVSQTAVAAGITSSDMGLVFGVGAKLFGFSGEIRYNLGLKNIATGTNMTAKSRHIDVLIGYWFF